MKALLPALIVAFGFPANSYAQTLAQYQAAVTSQNPSYYFKFDGSLESATDPAVVLEPFAGGYANDIYRNPSNSWFFNDQNTALLRCYYPILVSGGGMANSNATAKGSITFLFRMLSGPNIGGQRFLFDATTTASMGTTNHNALALFLENDTSITDSNALKLRFGDVTTTILPASNILYGSWYYFAITYDEARVPDKSKWYVGPAGRTLLSGTTSNAADAVAGEATGLFIGQRADMRGAYRSPGTGRIDEFAIWSRELSLTEISNQFLKLPQIPAGASFEQIVAAQTPKYYYKLNNSLTEANGSTTPLVAVGSGGAFTTDYLNNPGGAYSFSQTNDALSIGTDLFNGGGPGINTTATGVGAITLTFRMLSDTNYGGQRFIFSAPGEEDYGTNDNMLALYLENSASTNSFPGSLKLRLGNLTKGSTNSSTAENNIPVEYATNLIPNAWYYFAMSYDENRNTPEVYLYFGKVGGTLKSSIANPANSSVIGNNGPLALGNKVDLSGIGNNAFRSPGEGAIGDFAIWHEELSISEIQAQFDALAPSTPPVLSIAVTAGNVVLSWPTSGSDGFQLKSTASLVDSAWSDAGTPTLIGSANYVTNTLEASGKYYRLVKP